MLGGLFGIKRLTRVARVDKVDIYFHWSTLLIGGLILLLGIEQLPDALAALTGYVAVLLIHEWGHVMAARRRGCVVSGIEVYPFHGLTRMWGETSSYDEGVIAWGGPLAQLVVAIPVIIGVSAFGFSRSGPSNAILLLVGPFSVLMAILNLMPFSNLDGVKAWPLIPMLLKRAFRGRRVLRGAGHARAGRAAKKKWMH